MDVKLSLYLAMELYMSHSYLEIYSNFDFLTMLKKSISEFDETHFSWLQIGYIVRYGMSIFIAISFFCNYILNKKFPIKLSKNRFFFIFVGYLGINLKGNFHIKGLGPS